MFLEQPLALLGLLKMVPKAPLMFTGGGVGLGGAKCQILRLFGSLKFTYGDCSSSAFFSSSVSFPKEPFKQGNYVQATNGFAWSFWTMPFSEQL